MKGVTAQGHAVSTTCVRPLLPSLFCMAEVILLLEAEHNGLAQPVSTQYCLLRLAPTLLLCFVFTLMQRTVQDCMACAEWLPIVCLIALT